MSTVKDVMTTHVAAVMKTASYKDMAATLREQRVSAFPVIDDDHRVIGVVSESDLLARKRLPAPPGAGSPGCSGTASRLRPTVSTPVT